MNEAGSASRQPRTLFFDDGDVSSRRGVERVIHPARKHETNPLITADRPWEGDNVFLGGTVRKEGELYRMWYEGSRSSPVVVLRLCQ